MVTQLDALVESPFAVIELLLELVSHPDVNVRISVADHRSAPVEALMRLAEDESLDVRYALAENHNVHSDVLLKLSEDDNPYVAHRAQKTLARLFYATVSCQSIIPELVAKAV